MSAFRLNVAEGPVRNTVLTGAPQSFCSVPPGGAPVLPVVGADHGEAAGKVVPMPPVIPERQRRPHQPSSGVARSFTGCPVEPEVWVSSRARTRRDAAADERLAGALHLRRDCIGNARQAAGVTGLARRVPCALQPAAIVTGRYPRRAAGACPAGAAGSPAAAPRSTTAFPRAGTAATGAPRRCCEGRAGQTTPSVAERSSALMSRREGRPPAAAARA